MNHTRNAIPRNRTAPEIFVPYDSEEGDDGRRGGRVVTNVWAGIHEGVGGGGWTLDTPPENTWTEDPIGGRLTVIETASDGENMGSPIGAIPRNTIPKGSKPPLV